MFKVRKKYQLKELTIFWQALTQADFYGDARFWKRDNRGAKN